MFQCRVLTTLQSQEIDCFQETKRSIMISISPSTGIFQINDIENNKLFGISSLENTRISLQKRGYAQVMIQACMFSRK